MVASFDAWKRELNTLAGKLNGVSIPAKLSVKGSPEKQIEEAFHSEVLTEFLNWYVAEHFLPVVRREFGNPEQNPSPFMPKIIEGLKADGTRGFHRATNRVNTADRRGVKDLWAGGFRTLWQNVSRVRTSGLGAGGAMAGIGPRNEVEEQNLLEYPVTGGKATPSQYGSFFLAAEFGTGSFASVVRHSGKTKSDRGDGSWWFGNDLGFGWAGALFEGQRGIHFLYGKDGNTPNPVYAETLRSTLLPNLMAFLHDKYPSLRVQV